MISFGVLIVGYAVYGRVVEKVFSPDDRETPAVAIHDGVDCVPLKTDPATLSFETHEKFFDIQYMVTGEEQFGVCKLEGLKLCESHEDNDLYFYEEPAEAGTILLKEGDLIVVEPEEAHKPRLVAGGEKKAVKKVVVKVAV